MNNIQASENKSTPISNFIIERDLDPVEDQATLTAINKRVCEIEDSGLTAHTATRLAQLHVATALAHSLKEEQITRAVEMVNCGRELVKSRRNLGSDPLYRSPIRCKQRSCPRCSMIRGFKYSNMVAQAFKQLRFQFKDDCLKNQVSDDYKIIVIKVTLNGGTSCPLNILRDRTKALHHNWTRLLRTKIIKENLVGAIRSTEITESRTDDNEPKANPHIHGTLLLRMSADTGAVFNKIQNHWRKLTKEQLFKEGCLTPEASSSQCVQDASFLNSHTTKDATQWILYSTKGSVKLDFKTTAPQLTSSVAFWIAVDSAIKNMRMISTYGYLKDALVLVKEEMKLAKLNAPTPAMIDPTHPNSKLIWSDRLHKYIPASEYNESHDKMTFLCQSLDRTKTHPLLGKLFKLEHDQATRRKYSRSFNRLLNTGNMDEFRENVELILTYIKRSKAHSVAMIDPREPVEIERHLHKAPKMPENCAFSPTDTKHKDPLKTASTDDLKADQKN
jgi:hypothetical protein